MQLLEYHQYLDKLARRLHSAELVEALASGELRKKDDFKTKTKCDKFAKKLKKDGFDAKLAFDEEHSLHEIVVQHGAGVESRINWDLISHPEHKRMVELHGRLGEFNKPPFTVVTNGAGGAASTKAATSAKAAKSAKAAQKAAAAGSNGSMEKETPRELLDYLLEQGKRQLAITRFKGLGEMNPDQLYDTTMRPDDRLLKQVRMEDAVAADEIFTTLMGDDVVSRRKFIEDNALEVKNLDI